MAANLTELLYSLAGQAGALAITWMRSQVETSRRPQTAPQETRTPDLGALPALPSLPRLPSLQEALGGQGLASTGSGKASTPDVGGSYADEIEDLSVACVPCTRSHLSTMAMAAEEGARLAAAGDPRGARVQWARVAGEAAVMEALDWTPDKLARAKPADRAAIEEIAPQVRELAARTPAAPRHVVLAWSAVDESLRFARSPRPKPADAEQVQIRLHTCEDCMNYAERMILSPDGLQAHLTHLPPEQHEEARRAGPKMREARHRLVSSAGELVDLEFMASRLQAAVVALTPPQELQQATALAREYRELRQSFDQRIWAAIRQRRAG